jgi:hypothetical protein
MESSPQPRLPAMPRTVPDRGRIAADLATGMAPAMISTKIGVAAGLGEVFTFGPDLPVCALLTAVSTG